MFQAISVVKSAAAASATNVETKGADDLSPLRLNLIQSNLKALCDEIDQRYPSERSICEERKTVSKMQKSTKEQTSSKTVSTAANSFSRGLTGNEKSFDIPEVEGGAPEHKVLLMTSEDRYLVYKMQVLNS